MNLYFDNKWGCFSILYRTPRRVTKRMTWGPGTAAAMFGPEDAEKTVRYFDMDRRHKGRAIRKIRRLTKMLVPVIGHVHSVR